MLHVTNGASAGGSLLQSGLPGTVLTWDDLLHEGPVPAQLSLDDLTTVRARFIGDEGWGEYDSVLAGFQRRDTTLRSCLDQDEVVLWFEHDLYDQLQLLQILDAIATLPDGATHFSIICIGDYPVAPRFMGLGQLTPAQLRDLFPQRQPLTREMIFLGQTAWAAFREPDPHSLAALLVTDTSALPFLAGALVRLLEEYPAVEDDLSRTDRQLLTAISTGSATPPALFKSVQKDEESPFMGDLTFWSHIRALSVPPNALLEAQQHGVFQLPDEIGDLKAFRQQHVTLTPLGEAILAGQADAVRLRGIDRWIGGVHLQGPESPWRWHRTERRLQ